MLILSAPTAIGGDSGPLVVPHTVLPGSKRDHRFNREGHSRPHDHVVAAVVIVQDLDVSVKLLTNAMTNACPHNSVFVGFGNGFNRLADVADRAVTLRNGDANDGGDPVAGKGCGF